MAENTGTEITNQPGKATEQPVTYVKGSSGAEYPSGKAPDPVLGTRDVLNPTNTPSK